jgi:hypothetical protein
MSSGQCAIVQKKGIRLWHRSARTSKIFKPPRPRYVRQGHEGGPLACVLRLLGSFLGCNRSLWWYGTLFAGGVHNRQHAFAWLPSPEEGPRRKVR